MNVEQILKNNLIIFSGNQMRELSCIMAYVSFLTLKWPAEGEDHLPEQTP
jgi:hypothetical protein